VATKDIALTAPVFLKFGKYNLIVRNRILLMCSPTGVTLSI